MDPASSNKTYSTKAQVFRRKMDIVTDFEMPMHGAGIGSGATFVEQKV